VCLLLLMPKVALRRKSFNCLIVFESKTAIIFCVFCLLLILPSYNFDLNCTAHRGRGRLIRGSAYTRVFTVGPVLILPNYRIIILSRILQKSFLTQVLVNNLITITERMTLLFRFDARKPL
jgi:hypothetical protein